MTQHFEQKFDFTFDIPKDSAVVKKGCHCMLCEEKMETSGEILALYIKKNSKKSGKKSDEILKEINEINENNDIFYQVLTCKKCYENFKLRCYNVHDLCMKFVEKNAEKIVKWYLLKLRISQYLCLNK
jgi:hypothetical protein